MVRLATGILLMSGHNQKTVHASAVNGRYPLGHGVTGSIVGYLPAHCVPAIFHDGAECCFAKQEIDFHDINLT